MSSLQLLEWKLFCKNDKNIRNDWKERWLGMLRSILQCFILSKKCTFTLALKCQWPNRCPLKIKMSSVIFFATSRIPFCVDTIYRNAPIQMHYIFNSLRITNALSVLTFMGQKGDVDINNNNNEWNNNMEKIIYYYELVDRIYFLTLS